jgi:hypothetical protein
VVPVVPEDGVTMYPKSSNFNCPPVPRAIERESEEVVVWPAGGVIVRVKLVAEVGRPRKA